MTLTRRHFVAAAGSSALGLGTGSAQAQAQAGGGLKISHQFPGGTLTEGDFRDRLCRRFAADVEKKTNGALKNGPLVGRGVRGTPGGNVGSLL